MRNGIYVCAGKLSSLRNPLHINGALYCIIFGLYLQFVRYFRVSLKVNIHSGVLVRCKYVLRVYVFGSVKSFKALGYLWPYGPMCHIYFADNLKFSYVI